MTAEPGAVLEAARVQAGMAIIDVWLAYFALGGMEPLAGVTSILMGRVQPSDADYNMLAQGINEHFMDSGRDHPVPYRDEME